jgi:hypothetical protein
MRQRILLVTMIDPLNAAPSSPTAQWPPRASPPLLQSCAVTHSGNIGADQPINGIALYRVPDWFAMQFGIWAHWGPQCQPERGDWYAREMYIEGNPRYRFHVEHYGHPSKAGFKEVIHEWKAEQWDPDALVSLYKRVGAQYFFALANHHDNLDLWDSRFQPWNSVAVGPRKNIIDGWAKAARANGLRFGVSVHAAHSWSWFEPAQGADRDGPLAGVPYDGKLTKADGAGQWWDGLDPRTCMPRPTSRHPTSRSGTPIHALELGQQGDAADRRVLQEIPRPHARPDRPLRARPGLLR